MTKPNTPPLPPVSFWLWALAYGLIGSAMAINVVLASLAVPAMADYGYLGMFVAAGLGLILAIPLARWLAHSIHKGISED